jgi:tetratricopeptide (TPR) repeat protein
MDNDINKGNAVTVSNKSLSQLNRTLEITNKLLDGDIEELFNRGFCILNGLKVCHRNYYKLFETDPDFLSKIEFNFKEYRRPRKYFYKILLKKPHHKNTLILLSLTYSGYYPAFNFYIKKVVKLDPNCPMLHFVNALYYIHHEWAPGVANHELSETLKNYPNFYSALVLRGNFYRRMYNDGFNENIENDYERAIAISPKLGSAYLELACFIKENNNNKALELYSYIIENCLNIAHVWDALYSRGWMKFNNCNYEGALADFLMSLSYRSDISQESLYYMYLAIASTKDKLGDYIGALDYYTKTIEIYPKKENYFSRAEINEKIHNFEECIEDYSKGLKLIDSIDYNESEEIKAIYNKVFHLKEDIGDFEGANEYKKKYDWMTIIGMANEKFRLNDYEAALNHYNNLIANNPKDIVVITKRANLRKAIGDLEGALQDYNKTILYNPKEIDSYNARLELKINIKDYEGAISECDKIIDLDLCDLRKFIDTRATIKEKIGDLQGALEDYKKLLDLELSQTEVAKIYGKISGLKDLIGDTLGAELDRKSQEIAENVHNGYYLWNGDIIYLSNEDELKFINEVIEKNPSISFWYRERANIKARMEDFEGAKVDYELCISFGKHHKALKYSLLHKEKAYIQELLGDFQSAQKDWILYDKI